jgi:alpha-beta hydrolase superfamily lysophospholipase
MTAGPTGALIEGPTERPTERPVEFPSEGAILRGRLFLPAPAATRPAVVVMAHGFSATANGMVADAYARAFRDAGLAVLLYDHRNFGRSGGEPRQHIDNWLQVVGYRDAVAFVSTLREVDGARIAVWGDSKSGGCVLIASAFDPRIRAVVTQVPACGDVMPAADPHGAVLAAMAAAYAQAGPQETGVGVDGPMPVVAADQLANPSALEPITAFRWFMEYGGRYGTDWQNWVTVRRDPSTPYQPVLAAARVRVPALFVIAADDEMPGASSPIARHAFDSVPGPKELLVVDGGHFGLLYHPSELFDLASETERAFLVRHLATSGMPAIEA